MDTLIQQLTEARAHAKNTNEAAAFKIYISLLQQKNPPAILLREYGQALLAQFDDLAKATEIFEQALALEPDSLISLLCLAELYWYGYGKGYTYVIPTCTHILSLAPENPQICTQAYSFIASSYNSPGVHCNFEQVVEAYTHAIQCSPDNYETYQNLAMFLYEAGKLSEAKNAFLRARALLQKMQESTEYIDKYIQRIDHGLSAINSSVSMSLALPRWPDGDIA